VASEIALLKKTIRKHRFNSELYIKDYLLYDGLNQAKDVLSPGWRFFFWYFPRKVCGQLSRATARASHV
jgi:hypothetical protein